ncbi:MAG TPA: hypothetical protein VNV87_07240 [Acidimicrobiales bacterium]|jgi:hypothetical protein|nr:hypothetical protein [Acidimicrobiales bacterium]
MFDAIVDGPEAPSEADPAWGDGRTPVKDRAPAVRESLVLLAERARPTSSSESQLLPVIPPLQGLFPGGGLRRGTSIVVAGDGAGPRATGRADGTTSGLTLCLSLLGAASSAGSWCAAVGLTDLGAVAADDLGIDLDRLVLLPSPGPKWAEAAAALLGGVDVVVLCPPFSVRPAMARRLLALTRDRGAILIVLPGRANWPECPDLRLVVGNTRWDGIGTGDGHLRRRRVTVTATGRRSAARPRRRELWLPSMAGTVEDAGPDGPTDAPS